MAHPTSAACVITVEGELDTLTTPHLQACVRDQLAAHLAHLIIALPGLTFLGATGPNYLLETRDFTQRTHTGLHLAGPLTRAVARLLDVTGLSGFGDTYPTLAEALDALAAPTAPECLLGASSGTTRRACMSISGWRRGGLVADGEHYP